MEHVLYDGVDLAQKYVILGIQRPLPTPTPELELVRGASRNAMRGMQLVPPVLSFRIVATDLSPIQRREELRTLAPLILKTEPVRVEFGDDNGRYYVAVPSDTIDIKEFVRSGYLTVTMTCIEAAMYGDEHTVSSTNGTATFYVGGTYPTTLTISSTNATRASSTDYRFGYRLDNQTLALVEIGTSSSSNVVMEGATRHVTVNGATAQLTLNSNWYEVEPGSHTLTRYMGGGEFTVSWVERWL